MLDKEKLDKHFTDVQCSSVPPEGAVKPEHHFNKIYEEIDKLIKHLGVNIHDSYKTGSVSCRNIKAKKASNILTVMHVAYFEMLRESVASSEMTEEEKSSKKIQITRIEQAFQALNTLSLDLEKKLDINSVLFRMYGSLNELIKCTVEKL
tara:strand:+ start:1595 stop:2044 length:450 start_codon:yes stop_codon:yes gene_type:complete